MHGYATDPRALPSRATDPSPLSFDSTTSSTRLEFSVLSDATIIVLLTYYDQTAISCFVFHIRSKWPTSSCLVSAERQSIHISAISHHLAPISGSIEKHESPIAAAWRELKEETTLTAQDVTLWRQGKPFTFADTEVGRQWTIYPFSFRLTNLTDGGRGEAGIQIDWEHERWNWYQPDQVIGDENLGGVPRLTDSLRRVWFEGDLVEAASRALQSGLEQLQTDHVSGSHELTAVALRTFRNVLIHLENDPTWWESARMAAWHLWKNGRESMGSATLNAILGVLAEIDDIRNQEIDKRPTWNRILAVVDHHLQDRTTMPSRIKDSFVAYLQTNFLSTAQSQNQDKLTILTLSASSTIRDSIIDAFAALPLTYLDLRVLESRPLCEGVTMASSLLEAFKSRFPASAGRYFQLQIFTEASAALASTDVDFVLLGADCIASSGAVSNKAGSLPAALSAKHVSSKSKALIFSGLEKVAEPEEEENREPEENDGREVMALWMNGGKEGLDLLMEGLQGKAPNCTVQVKNTYFEWVPATLIDAYICEEGALDAAAIRNKASQVKENTDRYFGLL
ncbi:hypothetical protein N7462_009748 [Penicillium macrosclerotiorum]|uniref:uncharacterized protein n=1 Tax=Penicillium macrosclerotiorum TaxID=303699 RepID=UPI00254934DB|nr:uncharacterized protein N7462_009748 [Penicillium macrosclerotiorum]KAJ5668678.1 hypothetical protein N7462_009748 [Penicillium macrosclerotiorum]